jgi:hypothetical protein
MTDAEPASETIRVFKLTDEGKCPRICIVLTTHVCQKPLDKFHDCVKMASVSLIQKSLIRRVGIIDGTALKSTNGE